MRIVGAGSSGVQIAEELNRAGKEVYLSVGPHDRPPRSYRGRDFRAREAVRRRRSTLRKRIDGLADQERQAVFEHLAAAHGDAIRRALGREP